MMDRRRLLAAFVLVPTGAGLSGCFGAAPPVPKEQYFRLIAPVAAEPSTNPLGGIIEAAPLLAEGVLTERPLLFTANAGKMLQQRNYAYWTDPPPAMLRNQIIAYLRAAKAATDVVASELRVTAQYRLEGRLTRLEQSINGKSGGTIALDLSLIDKATDDILVSGSYESTQPAASEDIDDAVEALNAGLGDILARFLADLDKRG
jgi:ABC-type uncharacterized transport system auxiliary subunit